MPKSRSFGVPSVVTRMLPGFRSRWTTRCWCAYWTAAQTSRKRRDARRATEAARSRQAVERLALDVAPSTKYGRPSVGRAAVEQPRDVRVVEAGEDLALGAGSARAGTRSVSSPARTSLSGDALLERPRPLGDAEVDGAHAAVPELARGSRTARSAPAARAGRGPARRTLRRGRRLEEAPAPRRPRGGTRPRPRSVRVGAARRREERGALRRRSSRRASRKMLLRPPPALGRHAASAISRLQPGLRACASRA